MILIDITLIMILISKIYLYENYECVPSFSSPGIVRSDSHFSAEIIFCVIYI